METPGPSAVSEPSAPSPAREITQADIDAALQEWNEDPDSKRRVQQYMADHGREKGTADWLRAEYGDDLPAFPVTVEGAATDLSWPKVQRRIAQLIKEERFFTKETAAEKAPTVREIFDRYKPVVAGLVLEDVAYQNACRNSDWETAVIEGDAAVKRAALTITEPDFMRLYFDMPDFRYRLHHEVIDETYAVLSASHEATLEYDEETPPWGVEIGSHSPWGKVQTSEEITTGIFQISTPGHGGIMVRETGAEELLSPETLAAGGVEYGWYYFEEDDIAPIVFRELEDKGILPVPSAAPSDQPVTYEGDTISTSAESHEVEITDAAPPARDPLAPAYNAGDTVYLEDRGYVITDINLFDVQLQDPTQAYPILRSEPKDYFEAMLWKDPRNGPITEFLSADPSRINEDFREALTSGLLSERDKDYISGWLRSGESNTRIAQRLSERFAGQTDTFMLKTGEHYTFYSATIEMWCCYVEFERGEFMSILQQISTYAFNVRFEPLTSGELHIFIEMPYFISSNNFEETD